MRAPRLREGKVLRRRRQIEFQRRIDWRRNVGRRVDLEGVPVRQEHDAVVGRRYGVEEIIDDGAVEIKRRSDVPRRPHIAVAEPQPVLDPGGIAIGDACVFMPPNGKGE